MNVNEMKANIEQVKAEMEDAVEVWARQLGVSVGDVSLHFNVYKEATTLSHFLAAVAAGGKYGENNGSSWVKVVEGRANMSLFYGLIVEEA